MGLMPSSQADNLTARLGYTPRDRTLFVVALTHRSAEGPNNERLEFLGDSVLNLLLSERLYREFPMASEGDLSRLRIQAHEGHVVPHVADRRRRRIARRLAVSRPSVSINSFRRSPMAAALRMTTR